MNLLRIAFRVASRDECPCGLDAKTCEYHKDDPKYNKFLLTIRNCLDKLIDYRNDHPGQKASPDEGFITLIDDEFAIFWTGDEKDLVQVNSGLKEAMEEVLDFDIDEISDENSLKRLSKRIQEAIDDYVVNKIHTS